LTGLRAEHVPFRGAGPALTDVVAGHLHFMITTLPSVGGADQWRFRPAARRDRRGPHRGASERTAGADTSPATGRPPGTGCWCRAHPAAIKAKLYGAMRQALSSEDVIRRLRDEGASRPTSTPRASRG